MICFVLIISFICIMVLPEQGTALANDDLQITENDFIKAEGKKLKTKLGDEIILKGTNAGGYLLQEMWMTLTKKTDNVGCQKQIIDKLKERFPKNYKTLLDLYEDKYWQESDFDNCKELGMNVIRLPFWYKNLLDDNGNIISTGFERINWFVEQAGKRGIYVILDMHGVPGSQNGQDHSGDTTQGVSFFQGSNASRYQQTAINLWVEIARRYKDNPVVAGYDLLNEPYTSEEVKLTTRTVWDYYDKAYRAIRAVDSEHIIIMEATWEPSRLPNPAEYGWTNVMYEYHSYNYDSQTAAENQLASINKKLNNIDKADYNVPSYIGETSFFSNYDSWRACLQRMNDYGINYTTWTYKTTNRNSSWGIYNQTSSEADIENDSYDTIYSKWSRAGECRKNETLYNILKEYLNKPSLRKAEGTGRYETELYDEKVNGGSVATLTSDFGKSFSNDGYMEDLNGNHSDKMASAKYIQFFTRMNQTGKYKLKVGYATTTDTKFAVQINDNDWIYQGVKKTGAWNSVNTVTLDVYLNKGENNIRITGSVDIPDSWIILDYFELEKTDDITEETFESQTTKIQELTTSENLTEEETITLSVETKVSETTSGNKTVINTNATDKVTSRIKIQKVKIKKAKYRKKKIMLTFRKVNNAKGYQIQYSANKKFKKGRKVYTKKLKFILKRVKKKKYYFRVRAFVIYNKKKTFGKWSKKKTVTVK